MKKVLFIFGELSDDDIDWMITIGSREKVSVGTILIEEGKPGDALYILLEGTLSVKVAALGDKILAFLSSGEVVGEMSFIDSRLPSATVEAIEESLILAIPRGLLAVKLRQDVGFASRFYRAIALFLSTRLRGLVTNLGYGTTVPPTEEIEAGEVPPDSLDNVVMATARFDWLLRRLKET